MKANDRELVVEVARGIVTALDPEQERYLEADADAYFADPGRALSRAGADTPLGSGLEFVGAGLTIVALYVAEKALDVVTEKTMESFLEKLKIRRHKPAVRDLPELTETQVENVRRSVVAAAGKQGLDPVTADHIALTVVERLSGR